MLPKLSLLMDLKSEKRKAKTVGMMGIHKHCERVCKLRLLLTDIKNLIDSTVGKREQGAMHAVVDAEIDLAKELSNDASSYLASQLIDKGTTSLELAGKVSWQKPVEGENVDGPELLKMAKSPEIKAFKPAWDSFQDFETLIGTHRSVVGWPLREP